ncbi:MAG: copper homeostasis protein CutC [Bacteroidales bacterium]|nr:copper homeostasis protein CutC [Bacteroidales bacterium]
MKPILEVCCNDLVSVAAAIKGGADRIELCSALELGGLTPSYGLIRRTRSMLSLARSKAKLNVLIRPRPGDFYYEDFDKFAMLDDISIARELGADGVVIGVLTDDDDIDTAMTADLIDRAKGMTVTFHRAFDHCRDPYQALEDIIKLGCDHLLTSGLQPTALEGIPMLRVLNDQAQGRIKLIAASGINPENARQILDLTGLNEIHASASVEVGGDSDLEDKVRMGLADTGTYRVTSMKIVSQIIAAINQR